MKLRWSPTSPYVRKVLVTAIETGLDKRIEKVATNVHDPATDIALVNPLGKVPTLILDGGEVLYDSPVICEYLDSLHDGVRLFPPAGGARWTALRRQALADGLMDAAVARLLELRRPGERQDAAWVGKQTRKLTDVLDALEDEADSLPGPETIGHITIGCALGYLDFRFPDLDWRAERPALADWYAGFAGRASMIATEPKEP